MTDRVLALVGPTATGKSGLAVALARSAPTPIEVVAADAFTVYRGMDVGTAKPSADVRAEVAHHLIDVLEPEDDASVKWFQTEARRAIRSIHDRGHLPLLVGGSGLYFRAVVDDLRFPPTDPDVRAHIHERFVDDPRGAHAELVAEDPDAAAKIDPMNLRRSVRALEVIELTGEPFSSFADGWDEHRSVYAGLEVRGVDLDSVTLKQRIRHRAQDMVAAGLLEEAAELGGRELSRTARQAIGYAEAFAVLAGELAQDELVAAIAARTWRYARRQRSWFRRDPRVAWADPDTVLDRWF
ncbi:MAG: tRNA (adenosine(37)-N6)-dimethylallyltransferase MiaA [Actinobacteria bacterium]|nr:tRNA (adenosine(37)-N6)-dimethylallyltransferase MiaA [Actinomycetota bacterium]